MELPSGFRISVDGNLNSLCWVTVGVESDGCQWKAAYSPRTNVDVRPEYLAWRAARRLVGKDKPFAHVREVRNAILAGGFAAQAIAEISKFRTQASSAASAIVDDARASTAAAVAFVDGDDTRSVDMAAAFQRVATNVTVSTRDGHSWSTVLRQEEEHSWSTVTGFFMRKRWPESDVPHPVAEAVRTASAILTAKVRSVEAQALAQARLPGSSVAGELQARVYRNRLSHWKTKMRTAVKTARDYGLSDADMSAAIKELIIEEVHES